DELIGHVIESMTPVERAVRDRQGNRFLLRIRPYKSTDNRIEGAVLALFDIQDQECRGTPVRRSDVVADALLEAAERPVAVLDGQLRVKRVNAAFCRAVGISAPEAEDRPLFE